MVTLWIIYILTISFFTEAVVSYEFALRPLYGDVREGYVEMKVDGTWGILSDPGTQMSETTVRVLCDTLGYPGYSGFSTQTYKEIKLQPGTYVLFWNREIECTGTETDATECVNGDWINNNNWVTTLPALTRLIHCFDYNVTGMRLYGGVLPHEGRLEVFVGNRWGAVCTNFYDGSINPDKICSLLGCVRDGSDVMLPRVVDDIDPIESFWMSTLKCDDTDANINACDFVKGSLQGCKDERPNSGSITYAVYVRCEPAQLLNGTSQNTGIVEVGMNGKLQMLCGSALLDNYAADAICNVLGYQSSDHMTEVAGYVDTKRSVFSGSVQCHQFQPSVERCDIIPASTDCSVSTVLHIECSGGEMGIIPTGNISNIGIFTMDIWNTTWVIGSHSFVSTELTTNPTASRLCYFLGYGNEGSSQFVTNADLPATVAVPEHMKLEALSCHGNETDIAQCQRTFYHDCGRCPYSPPSGFTILHCTECPPGNYGKFCTACNCNNRSKNFCDMETGECTCIDGWTGLNCEQDVNECALPNMCPDNSICINTLGSFQCDCMPGYTKNIEGVCFDINECEIPTACPDNSVCINTPGSFQCECTPGFAKTDVGGACIDLDECTTPVICLNNSVCTNTLGSYQCECKQGYTKTDGVCTELIQEKFESNSNTLIIILSSVIGGLVLVAGTAVICLCKTRMKGDKNQPETAASEPTPWNGQDNNISTVDPSEEYSTIDDQYLRNGRETTNIDSKSGHYNTIDTTLIRTPNRAFDNKDQANTTKIGDYDYPYPAIIPKDETGYIKLGNSTPKPGVLPTDQDGYLKTGNVSMHELPTDVDGYLKSGNWGTPVLPKDDDGYLRMGKDDPLPTTDASTNYQKLNLGHSQDHEYERMKR